MQQALAAPEKNTGFLAFHRLRRWCLVIRFHPSHGSDFRGGCMPPLVQAFTQTRKWNLHALAHWRRNRKD
jgi:hypothetical protein